MKRIVLTLSFCLLCALSVLRAQEHTDTIAAGVGLSAQDIEDLTRPFDPQMAVPLQPSAVAPSGPALSHDLPLEPVLGSPYQAPKSFSIWPTRPAYPYWGTGYLYGFSTQHNDWLRGYQAMAGVGLMQQFGDQWSLDLNAQLYKNSIYYNSASFGSTLHWQANDHLGFTLFGNYSPGTFMSPVNFGPTFNWGGYVTMEGERFGLDLGAQQYYDPLAGHTGVPIVRPYVKFGEAKLGIDVGPLIRDALQKDHRRDNGFNPIPQPIKAVPQIAPRR